MTAVNDNDHDDDMSDGQWYRDVEFPMEEWRRAVEDDDTRANYMDWVLSMYEQEGRTPPARFMDEFERLRDDSPESLQAVPARYLNRYPEEDWRREVEEIDTRLGYVRWVQNQLQFDDEWNEEWARIVEAGDQAATLEDATPTPASTPRPRM